MQVLPFQTAVLPIVRHRVCDSACQMTAGMFILLFFARVKSSPDRVKASIIRCSSFAAVPLSFGLPSIIYFCLAVRRKPDMNAIKKQIGLICRRGSHQSSANCQDCSLQSKGLKKISKY